MGSCQPFFTGSSKELDTNANVMGSPYVCSASPSHSVPAEMKYFELSTSSEEQCVCVCASSGCPLLMALKGKPKGHFLSALFFGGAPLVRHIHQRFIDHREVACSLPCFVRGKTKGEAVPGSTSSWTPAMCNGNVGRTS